MVEFEGIRYSNFLATGQVPIYIRLNSHATTLIVGTNGSGKSTITEAITFALFNRPLRKINKPMLVNSINRKDTMVEIWFTVNEQKYHVKRGIAPAVFEIYNNGNLIPQPASIDDYQRMLEEHILGMNFKSFYQIVVLGSASYVPFMKLTAAQRREIVEDLLDIQIFGNMSALTKEELSATKSKMDALQQQRELLNQQRIMAETFTEQVTTQRDTTLVEIDAKIAETQRTLAELQVRCQSLKESLTAFDEIRQALADAEKAERDYESTLRQIEKKERALTKERTFYEENDDCPTCAQAISPDFKEEKFTALTKKEADAAAARHKCVEVIRKYQSKIQGFMVTLEEHSELQRQLTTIQAQAPLHKRRITELQRERLEANSAPQKVQTVDIKGLEEKVTDVSKELEGASRKRSILDTANVLLKDSGIKSKIVKHYLPIINKQINSYLTAMDFPIHFTLDQEFEEHMQSRNRDKYTYESFSEGEKKRIDLALLLTWRAVARLKNSAACNLLFLDEVFDSSMDAAGTEEFLKIIQALEKVNVFVISHKTDQLIDKFSHVLYFEKQRGFSTVKT